VSRPAVRSPSAVADPDAGWFATPATAVSVVRLARCSTWVTASPQGGVHGAVPGGRIRVGGVGRVDGSHPVSLVTGGHQLGCLSLEQPFDSGWLRRRRSVVNTAAATTRAARNHRRRCGPGRPSSWAAPAARSRVSSTTLARAVGDGTGDDRAPTHSTGPGAVSSAPRSPDRRRRDRPSRRLDGAAVGGRVHRAADRTEGSCGHGGVVEAPGRRRPG